MKKFFERIKNYFCRKMTPNEERNIRLWNDAMCGVKRCQHCNCIQSRIPQHGGPL